MKPGKYLLLITLLFFFCQKTSKENQVLATVGTRHITLAEFKDGVNFNPVMGKSSQKILKEKVLNSIIAEALLGQMDGTSSELVNLHIEQKKREAAIEALWEEIIFKDIQVSDSALWSFYIQTKKQREIEFAVFDDSVKAKRFYNELEKNNPAANQILLKDTISFTGDMAILEKEVFAAKRGEFSKPLKIAKKHLVYMVRKEWQTGIINKQDFNQKLKSIKKNYLQYTKQQHFFRYVKDTFKREKYRLNIELFKKLTYELEKIFLNKPDLKGINAELLNYSTQDFSKSKSEIVTFANGDSWTGQEYLKHLAVSPYPLNYKSHDGFRYSMIRAAKRILDDELLYRKALEHDLDKGNYVKWQSSMWHDFYKATYFAKKINPQNLTTILDSLKTITPINVNWKILDTLTISPSNMMVLKTHFPGQTIVPKQNNWEIK